MRITLDSTSQIVQLVGRSGTVPARLWQGTTESGVKIHCLITRIAVSDDENQSEFQSELMDCQPPTAEGANIFPLRMIL